MTCCQVSDRCPLGYLLENVVSSNTEISQVRTVPISPNRFLNKKSQMEPVVIWCVFASEDSFVFRCLFFGYRCGANFDQVSENAYKTNFTVLNDP